MPRTPRPPRSFGPSWFATVMGTGILANAAATLPLAPSWLPRWSLVAWLLASVLLVVVLLATAVQHVRWPGALRHYLGDGVVVHFYGAPALALLTVGGGAVSVGTDLLGTTAALVVAGVLLGLGTLLGVVVALGVPWLLRARGEYDVAGADATWLMPVVPLLVSAAVSPLLSPYVPSGAPRLVLLGACTVLAVLGLASAGVVLAPVARRLRRLGSGPPEDLPPTWILLGLLGQAVTAVHTIGDGAVDELGDGWAWLGPAFGLPVIAAALVLLAVLVLLTGRALLQRRLGFAMTWWSFVFPTGTVVTGTSALATSTGLPLAAELAAGLYVLLVLLWAVVATLTVRGVLDRSLLPRVEDADLRSGSLSAG